MARFLELAAVLLCPALDNNFLVRVELDGVSSLPVQVAEKTILPSAERKIGHGRRNTNVDPDIPCRSLVTELPRCGPAGCEQRCLVAIGTAFQKGERLIHVIGMHEAEHWSEDFGIGDLAAGRHVVENRWLQRRR